MSEIFLKQLKNNALRSSEKIRNAQVGGEYFDDPYKHLVVDNFLNPAMADFCLQSFPILRMIVGIMQMIPILRLNIALHGNCKLTYRMGSSMPFAL